MIPKVITSENAMRKRLFKIYQLNLQNYVFKKIFN